MNLKRHANLVSAGAGAVLLVGGIAFTILTSGQPEQPADSDRILNVGVYREPAGNHRGSFILIQINGDGKFVIDGEIMPDEELLRKLKTMARVAPDTDVRIYGADGTSWDSMIRAVDLIETTGLTNVTFETRKPLPE